MSIFDRFINIIKGGSNNTMDDRISPALFRPVDAYIPMGTSDVAKVPILPMHFRFMYDLYYYSDILRTVIRAIIWEVFRNGIEIKKKFISKCTVCGKEYGEVVEVCEDCGSRKIRQPNWRERLVLEKYLKDANLNDQSLVEVLKDIAADIAVTDNAFLVVVKEYEFDENGEVVGARPVEVIRGSPLKMRLVMNRNGRMGMTDDGKVVAFCLNHRNEYKLLTQDEMKTAKCDKCGCKLFPAYYKMESGGIAGGSSSSGTWGSGNVWSNTGAGGLYYTDGEVLHIKLFTTGIGYGHSPILSIWLKVMILMKMDWFVLMAYHFQRPPKGLLILRGNRESIAKSWEWLMEQARTNPHMIMPLVVEGTQETGARRVAEFLDLTVKSNDIDFIAYRDELRKSIGACYDEETELLTDRGWLRWNEIKVGDKALCYDVYTKKLYWKPIRDVKVFDWDGDVYHFETKSYDLMITPEHRIVKYDEDEYYSGKRLSPHIGQVCNITNLRGIYPQAGVWEDGEDFDGIEIIMGRQKERIKLEPHKLLEFIGLYIAEGWRSKDKYYKVYITQNLDKNGDKCEYIENLLNDLGLKYYISRRQYKSTGQITYVINCKDLHEFLGQFGDGAGNKTVAWIKDLKREYIESFLRGYFIGDGCERSYGGKGKVRRFITKSKVLVDEIQEMLIKVGIGAVVQKTKSGHYAIDTRIDRNGDDKWYSRIRKENVRIEKYKGKVWDVDVGGEFIVVRRNGRPAIQSNCYGVMPLWQGDTRGGLSNEGLQITVTNRTVEMWHRLFNDNVLKWLIRQLGVEDYIIELRPNEMRDEYSRLELEMKKVQLASALKALGYKPILAPDAMGNIEFKFEKAGIEEQLREILTVVGNQYNVSPDDLYSALTERITERVNPQAAAMAGGHEVVGQVGEGGGEQGVEPDTPISEILENLENEDEKTHEHARAEGEPKGMRPRRYDQRYEGEPQLPRR